MRRKLFPERDRKRVRVKWPVLRRYEGRQLDKIAMPLGGIGTGTLSLGGRGDLRDWEVMNTPRKGFVPGGGLGFHPRPSAVLWCQAAKGVPVARLLEGPLGEHQCEGMWGSTAPNHGLPRFARATFNTAYPLAEIELADRQVPVRVALRAFNPFVPGDVPASSWPMASLCYRLENPTRHKVKAAICVSLPNFIGVTETGKPCGNRNRYREGRHCRGVVLESRGVPRQHSGWGTLALTTSARAGASYRTGWADLSWGDSLLEFWEDFGGDGMVEERWSKAEQPMASLAVRVTLQPGETREIPFLLTWHFPNRLAWKGKDPQCCGKEFDQPDWVGNHYTTCFRDAWGVATRAWPELPGLERRTVEFVRAFCASDAPAEIKEAALFNLSTLRSQTCFRTADGRFFGWEGCGDSAGCCQGSCTHVWNYEQGLGFMFGELSRSLAETAFGHCTDERGRMRFRVDLPLDRKPKFQTAAADGQMGAIMRFYRDWQLSGDETFLQTHWPKVRKALEFCWIKNGWDGDQDGVMEGCQHNTMDVEYYGPNPQMGTWYLGALRACEEMARYLGEGGFADKCRRLFEAGSRWMDAHLFNGEYYEHHIVPARSAANVAPELILGMGAKDFRNPELQLGAGCLIDQLVGQYFAHVCGLGYLLKPANVRRALRSIKRYNWRNGFRTHFNHLRSFAMDDESGLLMATYPRGRRPRRPFPYCNEVMTGYEYTAAAHMVREGMRTGGRECISAIRARYDGLKRNPFNEAECGYHYARALASWAAYLFWNGFRYSAVSGAMEFAASAKPATWFWSTGQAWGTCRQRSRSGGIQVTLEVKEGRLRLRQLRLIDTRVVQLTPMVLKAGQSLTIVISRQLKA